MKTDAHMITVMLLSASIGPLMAKKLSTTPPPIRATISTRAMPIRRYIRNIRIKSPTYLKGWDPLLKA